MFSFLALLGSPVSNLLPAKLALVLTVREQLLTADVLGLECPECILLLFALLEHLVVVDLELAFVHDAFDLAG